MRHALLRAGFAALALLVLTGCADDGTSGSNPAVTSGDPAACPGEIVDVVVSIGAWSDVVRGLGGDCATVITIAPDAEAPAGLAPGDRSAFGTADLVVVNGARFDEWAAEAIDAAGGDPVVVDAAEASAAAGARVDDPHLWYDPDVVPHVAAAIAAELGRLSPDAAPYFDAQHMAWTAELQAWLQRVDGLRDAADGRTAAATDGASRRLAGVAGLSDVTPDDDAALEELLRSGRVDVLVLGDDPGTAVPDRLREAAGDGDVPVVEVTTVPPEDAAFVEWQLGQLTALAEAFDGG